MLTHLGCQIVAPESNNSGAFHPLADFSTWAVDPFAGGLRNKFLTGAKGLRLPEWLNSVIRLLGKSERVGPGQMDQSDERELRERLAEMRAEHRELDSRIVALEETTPFDQISIRRLKKKKAGAPRCNCRFGRPVVPRYYCVSTCRCDGTARLSNFGTLPLSLCADTAFVCGFFEFRTWVGMAFHDGINRRCRHHYGEPV